MEITLIIDGVELKFSLDKNDHSKSDLIQRIVKITNLSIESFSISIGDIAVSVDNFLKSSKYTLFDGIRLNVSKILPKNDQSSIDNTIDSEHLPISLEMLSLLIKQINKEITNHHYVKKLGFTLCENIDEIFLLRGISTLSYRLMYTIPDRPYPQLACVVHFIHRFAIINLSIKMDKYWNKIYSFILSNIPKLSKHSSESDLSELITCLNEIIKPISPKMDTFTASAIDGFVSNAITVTSQLMMRVLKSCPVKTIINIAKSCRSFKELVDSGELWRHLLFRDFQIKIDVENPKEKYASEYLSRHSRRTTFVINPAPEINPYYVPNPSDYFDPSRDTNRRFPPGIIGGPRDMFPGGIIPFRRNDPDNNWDTNDPPPPFLPSNFQNRRNNQNNSRRGGFNPWGDY